VACFGLSAAVLSAGPPEPTPQRVDEMVKWEMERQGIPGLSLAVVRDGKVVLAKGYGLANVELGVAATPETVYQLQSLSKSFTATGIMMLVEQGKVGLDDRVGKHLEVPTDRWKNITVRHLLSHTSGIKDFINEPAASLRLDATEEEVLRAAARRPLNFEPGEKYAYSNTNYHLLAMVIRKVTGKPYGEFLRERIFDPLGMGQTRVISLAEIIPNRAAGYRRERGSLRNGEYVAPTILGYGGGGLRSTVLDLAKWDAALYTEKLLKQSTLQQMWAPAKLNSGKPAAYGFGWGIGTIRGHRCLSHTGAHVTGFATALCRFVDDKLTVIVLSNLSTANAAGIAQRIARLYIPGLGPFGPKPPEDKRLENPVQTGFTSMARGPLPPLPCSIWYSTVWPS
jgi:CubicO group peptidase (beta-lactamase class C family)